jgi:hypothetical protein
MRSMLINQVTRNRPAWLRWLAPWLAAVAVPAIATAGFLVVPGGDQHTAPPPGGPSSSLSPSPSSSLSPSPSPSTSFPVVTPTPAVVPKQRTAYSLCVTAVRERFLGEPDAPGRSLAGKVAKHGANGWTVVVADGVHAWACSVDDAVSPSKSLPAPPLAQVGVSDVAVSDNVLGWEGPQSGEYVWAGGPVPRGVTTIRYTFPDGHVEPAVLSGGFWAMRYDALATFVPEGHNQNEAAPISVRLSGPGGTRTFKLAWGEDTCNQVSHGC